MSLTSHIRLEFECATCGADCVDSMDRVAKRHPTDSICALCEELAEAAVIGLVVDVGVLHSAGTGNSVADPGNSVADPYARTQIRRCEPDGTLDEQWYGPAFREAFRPPVQRADNWWVAVITVTLVIAAAVVIGRWLA